MEYIDHRINNNEATDKCRKRKQAKLEQEKAALEMERAKRLEAERRARESEERAKKAELRMQELEVQVEELTKEIECSRAVDNEAELQECLNDVLGEEMTANLRQMDVDDVWDKCHQEDQ